MRTWAIINTNTSVVDNCILAESKEIAENAANNGLETPLYTAVEYFLVEPGWSYVDNNWISPA